jgi:hypothetical protein
MEMDLIRDHYGEYWTRVSYALNDREVCWDLGMKSSDNSKCYCAKYCKFFPTKDEIMRCCYFYNTHGNCAGEQGLL